MDVHDGPYGPLDAAQLDLLRLRLSRLGHAPARLSPDECPPPCRRRLGAVPGDGAAPEGGAAPPRAVGSVASCWRARGGARLRHSPPARGVRGMDYRAGGRALG